jgi:type I restriction enzyme S subunit
MAARYQGYDKYKALDFPFLDKIPDSWKAVPLNVLSDFRQGKLHEPYIHEDGKFICVNSRFVSTEGKKVKFCSKNLSPVRKSDILMVMSDLPNGRALAKAFWVEGENNFALNQRVCAITPQKVDSRFLYYQLDRNPYFLAFDDGSNQTNLSNDVFKKYPVLLPSANEQQTIANFLDHETAKIDTLIDKQQQLITLLKEKRQAVISHAATKGINPNALMRDSGVEWLGEVPEHWDVSKVKWVVDMAGRIGYRGYTVDDIVDEDEGAIVLSPSNINERGFNLDKKVFLSWNKYFESPEIKLEPGDVMLVKTSWSFGKVAVVTEVSSPMTINPQMVLLKKSKIDPRFVSYFLNIGALQARIFMINTGSYMPTMTQENIGELTMFIPPMQEATDIADFIQKQQFKFNTLMDKQERVIELLLERRKALISAAVTGKIDVRNWAAPATTNKNKEVAA